MTAAATGRRGLVRQSSLTSVAAGLGVLAGLALDIAIAAQFGAGRTTDAFFVAARIPLGLIAVIMVAANQVLVPAFSTSRRQRGERATSQLVSVLITTLAVGGAVLTVLAVALATPLTRLTAPGLGGDEVQLAAQLLPVCFAMVPLVAIAEVLRAYCNARYAFVAPAAMNVVMNGLAAAMVMLLARGNIAVVAWAYVAGALVQTVFMVVMAIRRGLRFVPSLRVRDAEVRRTAGLCVRPLIGAGTNPLARIGEQLVISFLPAGSITIVTYAYRLISAIGGTVFFRSVIVALVPRLTEATVAGDHEEVERISRLGTRIMLAVSLPLTAFMVVLARPGAEAVFQRGHFTHESADLLGLVLAVYAGSLVFSALQRAYLAPFFARLDTRTPLRNTLWVMAVNLALVPLLTLPFGTGNSNAVIGVAAAFTLAQVANVWHMVHVCRRAGLSPWADTRRFTVQLAFAALVSGAVMQALTHPLALDSGLGRWTLLSRTLADALVGVAVLSLVLAVVTAQDPRTLLRTVRGARRAGRRPVPPAGDPAPAEAA